MKDAPRKTGESNTDRLYKAFVRAAERKLGKQDELVIHAIVPFDLGGPPDVLQFSKCPEVEGTFYVTSDLLFQEEQPNNSLGKYEFGMCVKKKDARWAQEILSKIAWTSMEDAFDSGHTMDIGAWVGAKCRMQGLILTKLFSGKVGRKGFGTLLCVGVTRPELEYAMKNGSRKLERALRKAGAFPVTDLKRASIA